VRQATTAPKAADGAVDVAALTEIIHWRRLTLTSGNVTEIDDSEAPPLDEAKHFAGLYSIEGSNHPEPSSLDAQRVAETLRGLMARANWQFVAHRPRSC
jgi:hypothetical protein